MTKFAYIYYIRYKFRKSFFFWKNNYGGALCFSPSI